jgi:hypothetical protein
MPPCQQALDSLHAAYKCMYGACADSMWNAALTSPTLALVTHESLLARAGHPVVDAPLLCRPFPACSAQWWMVCCAHASCAVRIAVVSAALLPLSLRCVRSCSERAALRRAPPTMSLGHVVRRLGEWAALSHACSPTTACGQAYLERT